MVLNPTDLFQFSNSWHLPIVWHCWCALLPLANTPLPSVLQFVYNSLYGLPACSLMAPPHSLHTWPSCRASVFLCGLVRSWGVEGCTTSTPPVVEKAEGRRCGGSIGSSGEVGEQRSAGHGEGAAGDGLCQSDPLFVNSRLKWLFSLPFWGFFFPVTPAHNLNFNHCTGIVTNPSNLPPSSHFHSYFYPLFGPFFGCFPSGNVYSSALGNCLDLLKESICPALCFSVLFLEILLHSIILLPDYFGIYLHVSKQHVFIAGSWFLPPSSCYYWPPLLQSEGFLFSSSPCPISPFSEYSIIIF